MKIEICSDSLESILIANRVGANSIELCSCMTVGGVTPSSALIKKAVEISKIPIHCLIRPREGHFVYNDYEFNTIINDIKDAKENGVKGIVIGVLTEDFKINITQLDKIIKVSKGLKITFHRAFDSIVDSKKAIDLLSKIGVNRILSSGKANKAVNGIKNLIDWKNYDSKILIQPGGGIDKSSALLFKNEGFESIHLSGTLEEKWNRPIPKSTDNTFIKQTVRRPSFKKMEDIIVIAKN
tara:strand:- start:1345 stop:2061 length:717 start_codon:yes stop_codon:yes gene_type:complete